MVTRKFPSDEREKNASKRRRVEDERDTTVALDASFDSLPSDCKVNIFSFLPTEDMNSAAICSKDCLQVRANESLDQERIGTIILTQNTSPASLDNTVIAAEEKDVFSGNCTCLKIDGVDRVQWNPHEDTLALLTGVNKLILSSLGRNRTHNIDGVHALIEMCPNVSDIVMNNIKYPSETPDYISVPISARRLEWNGCNGLLITGGDHGEKRPNLRELYLDESEFDMYFLQDVSMNLYGSPDTPYCLFETFQNVERVSMKGATMRFVTPQSGYRNEVLVLPMPQEYIIKFVRRCSTLRWLRSDLSVENVAMLKADRPEVTFLSE